MVSKAKARGARTQSVKDKHELNRVQNQDANTHNIGLLATLGVQPRLITITTTYKDHKGKWRTKTRDKLESPSRALRRYHRLQKFGYRETPVSKTEGEK